MLIYFLEDYGLIDKLLPLKLPEHAMMSLFLTNTKALENPIPIFSFLSKLTIMLMKIILPMLLLVNYNKIILDLMLVWSIIIWHTLNLILLNLKKMLILPFMKFFMFWVCQAIYIVITLMKMVIKDPMLLKIGQMLDKELPKLLILLDLTILLHNIGEQLFKVLN